jgi:hypothetical protein
MLVERRQPLPEPLVEVAPPRGSHDGLEDQERRGLCRDGARTRGIRSAPASASQASPRASAGNMVGGARRLVFTKARRPSASATRYASLMSPPEAGSARSMALPSARATASRQSAPVAAIEAELASPPRGAGPAGAKGGSQG